MEFPVIDVEKTGRNLKELSIEKGYTARGIGQELGIAQKSTVCKWFRGDVLPGIDNLVALSRLLEVPIDELIIVSG